EVSDALQLLCPAVTPAALPVAPLPSAMSRDYSRSIVLEGHTNYVYCVLQFSGTKIASGSNDNNIRIWNLVTMQCEMVLAGHTGGGVLALALWDANRIVSGSGDKTVRIWDTASGECLKVLKGHTDFVRCAVVLSNGNMASGSHDKTIRVWDSVSGACLGVM